MQVILGTTVIRFVEIIDECNRRVHIGCLMGVGSDWVEVSLPERINFSSAVCVRFLPSIYAHEVSPSWRKVDRVGFIYIKGGPSEEQFVGTGLLDPRPAYLKQRSVALEQELWTAPRKTQWKRSGGP